ncbi:heterokaryon incompatibility protein-domain-containing protein [Sordaria brevicollis]|uniref:Heterokaryon incompatibility protein-domain-containing protein n=1 Tax=Sordaria brevicollis TaxID=83679 RepID=A0AAE0PNI3_SORBR|nr:heterokaryon incompatibility protein-domain-containing protein [Sordaria brevicollis]
MSSTSSQPKSMLCTNCNAINFDEILSNDYILGIPSQSQRTLSSLRHIDDTSYGSCSFCDFLRDLKTDSDPLSLLAWRATDRLFAGSGINQQKSRPLQLAHHETVVFDIKGSIDFKTRDGFTIDVLTSNQFMELGAQDSTQGSNDKITARKVGNRVNFELIKSWLSFCRAHHQGQCHTELDGRGIRDIPGFRVIDCESRKIIPWAEIPKGHDGNYAALSYLWGTDTSTATRDGMIPSPSPKVIEDAVTATTELGFKYLWVDRYCIPQHDLDQKAAQIKRMDDVYGSSAITIIASAGDGPAHGLPGVNLTPRLSQKSVRIGSRTFISINNNTNQRILDSKWNTRAWTLQEGFLSPRRLCFEDSQVYFQCNLMHRLESIHIPNGKSAARSLSTDVKTTYSAGGGHSVFPRYGMKEASSLLEAFDHYISRQISYPQDGLNAFEGILKRASTFQDPVYTLWGVLIRPLPTANMTTSLITGLSWMFTMDSSFSAASGFPLERQYRGKLRRRLFPSWSWVDWVGDLIEKAVDVGQPLELWQDKKSTTIRVYPLIMGIVVQYADGAISCWEDNHHDILMSARLREGPRILRIRGYTCETLLWKLPTQECLDSAVRPSSTRQSSSFLSNDGWTWSDQDRSLDNLLLAEKYNDSMSKSMTNNHLCICADWLQTHKKPSSPSPLQDEYSFRVILLSHTTDRLNFMVLTPVDRDKGYPGAYERVNIISRPSPLKKNSPETLLENPDPKFLRGWTLEETIIV